jgi:hypothetical protein
VCIVPDRDLIAREGDVIVVSYPEVKLPLKTRYATVAIGGLIYTRRLVAGDVVQDEYEKIYSFLRSMSERDAREKVKLWSTELAAAVPPPLPPKPLGGGESKQQPQPQQVQPQSQAMQAGARPKPTTAGQR